MDAIDTLAKDIQIITIETIIEELKLKVKQLKGGIYGQS